MTETSANPEAARLLFPALDALLRGDVQPWVDMFHEDGVMEFPYAPPGWPRRLRGQQAIAAYLRPYPERISVERVLRREVHACGPVAVAEFTCRSVARRTGVRFDMDYVGVFTVEQGKVRRYRDYWNPLVALEVMGGDGLPPVAAGEETA